MYAVCYNMAQSIHNFIKVSGYEIQTIGFAVRFS